MDPIKTETKPVVNPAVNPVVHSNPSPNPGALVYPNPSPVVYPNPTGTPNPTPNPFLPPTGVRPANAEQVDPTSTKNPNPFPKTVASFDTKLTDGYARDPRLTQEDLVLGEIAHNSHCNRFDKKERFTGDLDTKTQDAWAHSARAVIREYVRQVNAGLRNVK